MNDSMHMDVSPNQIMRAMKQKSLALTAKNDELPTLAEKKAEAERDYHIEVSKKTFLLKQENPVTIVKELVKGDKAVADLKFKADMADAVYKACCESIKDLRSAIDVYRSLLAWKKAEMLRTE